MKAQSLSDWASKTRTVGPQPWKRHEKITLFAYDRKTQICMANKFQAPEALSNPRGWRSLAAERLLGLRRSLHSFRNNPPAKDSYLWR